MVLLAMINKQLNSFEGEASCPELQPQPLLPLDELEQKISELEKRINKGKSMIEAYQSEYGAENMVYRRQLIKLTKEWETLNTQRTDRLNRQLSFQIA